MKGCSALCCPDYVEPSAFGGEFFAALGHQAHRMRPGRKGYSQHIRGRRHLGKFSGFPISALSRAMSPSWDVAAILAQMRGDAVSARRDRGKGRAYRVGIAASSRITQRGDVVDIDSETQRRIWHAGLVID